MSYIAKQKIKGNIYLYHVDSYWDKDKKQSRQKELILAQKTKKEDKKEQKPRKSFTKSLEISSYWRNL